MGKFMTYDVEGGQNKTAPLFYVAVATLENIGTAYPVRYP